MTRVEALCVWSANLLTVVTGVVYAWMAYFAVSEDPDAVVNHPLQPAVQHGHVLVAPLLVFAVGLVWRAHVWARLRSGQRERRPSGLALLLSFTPMCASGYLLQVSTDPDWRDVWIWVHVATSLGWTIAFGAHQLARRRMRAGPGA
jgi:hypothetical protein